MNKKYFISSIGASALLISQFTVGIGAASAVTACLDFDTFCDSVEVTYDSASGVLSGVWDATCDGATFSYVLGANAVMGGTIQAFAIPAVSLKVNFAAKTADLWQYDGVSPPVQLQSAIPWNWSGGSCNFGAAASDKPSSLQ